MSEQFQCRFCPHSYTKVLEFLDHFETHMNQNEQIQDEQQNASHQNNLSKSKPEKEVQNHDINVQNPKYIAATLNIKLKNGDIRTYVSNKDLNSEKNSCSLNQSYREKENVKKSTFCEKCEKTYSSKQKLNVHIKTVHDKVKSHKCNLCLKTFGQKGDLQKHIKTVHEKVKPFDCDLCLKAF